MTKKHGWYKRDPSKFIAGTVGMRWEVKACYSILCDLIWDGQGSCPDDPNWIANIIGVGMSVRRWNTIRAELIRLGKIKTDGARLFFGTAFGPDDDSGDKIEGINPVLSGPKTASPRDIEPPKIKDKAVDKIVENRDGLFPDSDLGEKTLEKTRARARTPSESESESEETSASTIILTVEKIASLLGRPKGKYWETQLREMIQSGLTCEAVLEAVKAHDGCSITSLKAFSTLAWRKQKNGQVPPPAPPRQDPAQVEVAIWADAMVRLSHRGTWPESSLGPMPGTPGFQGPKDLEAQWLGGWRNQGSHPLEELDANHNFVAYPARNPDPMRRARWSSIK